ncbi:MAG: protein translocase subunit SecD [Thiotrichales bacterium]|jgi:preprotein translocase subunit SecD|nr:protein translocase subunit SecD [Thiotrichales bacterium]MBT3613498.1 protein translocase subunit SecD [Thiotrichales bacterium]MBT3753033.1 protein translocase subunit SecD [Thiotrichales bacterium]MBT3837835.1 protein translocase subunit SecD [Thiotrichales bacterium]MBT4151660.1 protein translocase subunit SecD [Thiotrichales bacterium]
MNKYPVWKYLLILTLVLVAAIYALPNMYGEDPAVQVSLVERSDVDSSTAEKVETVLKQKQVPFKSVELIEAGVGSKSKLLVRFNNTEDQLIGLTEIRELLGNKYITALNLAQTTPTWLRSLGAEPMYLGLDLRGGVHFLMEVDMDEANNKAEERYVSDLRVILRKEKVRYKNIGRATSGGVELRFANTESRISAMDKIKSEYPLLTQKELEMDGFPYLLLSISEKEMDETRKFALQQNITTLRNRVNELGVAEPVIQQQGKNRIVVQLPGVQDTARAKEILGATATLEFRLVAEGGDAYEAERTGHAPGGALLYKERDGTPVLLKRRVLLTGDSVIDASSGLEQQSGSAAVFITLDGKGARRMSNGTRDNIGKRMAVVFIETKMDRELKNGKSVKVRVKKQEVINVAVIRDQLGKRFQVTGLDSTEEARDLALLLRAGALAVPMEIVEERTVGPSLGQDNIDKGFLSVMIGFVLVLIFMAIYYKAFGMVANIALTLNLIFIVSILSLLQATLTLPGIAGIVLTVGMAVDANVLIFERIREELRSGNALQASIHAGYDKAFSTIMDANVTTLIAAVVLFAFGTGPIKGFAVTLTIGIITSMFTAIMGTRAVVNLVYGGRKISSLSI